MNSQNNTDANSITTPGGDLELALLEALWALGLSSARELYNHICLSRTVGYTTITKVLDRLCEKGLIRRRSKQRKYHYESIPRRENTYRAMARDLIERLSGAGPQPAVAALVGALNDISPQLLEQLEAEIKARKESNSGA